MYSTRSNRIPFIGAPPKKKNDESEGFVVPQDAYLSLKAVYVGRIDFAKLARAGGNLATVPCTVWRRLPDTPWNRLFAAAVHKIRSHPSLRDACRAELVPCEAILEGVKRHPVSSQGVLELPRNAASFAPVCALAQILLANGGIQEETKSLRLSFVVNLEQLFERTVTKAFRDAGVRCLAKHNLPYTRDNRKANFQMDLFCPDLDGEPVVVDAKYKTKVSPSNLQQMVTYCVMTGAKRAILVLPSNDLAGNSYSIPTVHGTIRIDLAHFDVANQTVAQWRQSAARFVEDVAGRTVSRLDR